jgi:capsular polysaccharide transport system permease protein
MTTTQKESHLRQRSASPAGWLRNRLIPALARRRFVSAALAASLLATLYWVAIASDRFVSEAHIIIQRTDMPGGQAMDFSSLLGSVDSGNRADQLLLRDYLLSVDTLKRLDAELNLRAHYSDTSRDPLSRMWRKNTSMEWFYRYYLSRVSIEFDDYSGVLVVKAQGYDAKTAHAITAFLVQEGGRFMNELARGLAKDQVSFLEKQVSDMSGRATDATHALVAYQNKKGLLSPQATTESIAAIIARLEGQRSDLETRRSTSRAYLVPNHPDIVQIEQQLDAVAKQVAQEQAKLVSTKGKTLNSTVEEYQALQTEAEFAADIYKTALVALEKGRLEASRNIKKISILQEPSMPEYSLEPRRFYNSLVFTLVCFMVAGVAHLIAAIVRDHKD